MFRTYRGIKKKYIAVSNDFFGRRSPIFKNLNIYHAIFIILLNIEKENLGGGGEGGVCSKVCHFLKI